MKNFRWLHLSDFHFGKNDYEQTQSALQLIAHLREKKGDAIIPDMVFITGDVANSSKSVEYEKFKNCIFEPLLDLYGKAFESRIQIVPGNHDLDRTVNSAFSKAKLLQADGGYFLPTVSSLSTRKILVDRFANYFENSGNTNSLFLGDAAGVYTAIDKFGDLKVGVFGINTAWLCDGEEDKENLTPGFQLIRDALQEVKDVDIKFVLGHHPLDWMHRSVSQPLHALFGKHNVIYLHGHMHESWATPYISPAGDFLAIQTGAAWQAPEGSKWKNGFLWGELTPDRSNINLQPFTWSFKDQCWSLHSGAFHEKSRVGDKWQFPAPGRPKNVDYTPRKKKEQLVGWVTKDLGQLEGHQEALSADEALKYFDGATPTWEIALSMSIPRREIVSKIVSHFAGRGAADDPKICLLLAAGCEGKTTAVLQASYEILKHRKAKRILYRTNHVRSFNVAELMDTISEHDDWLLVIDEADQAAKEILRFIDSGFDGYEGRIDVLLASRDSDWNSAGANILPWGATGKFKEIFLKDLSTKDAQGIVTAWGIYGREGLGEELASLDAVKRAERLRFFAKREEGNAGAFFGALLMCRHGSDLLDHAEKMLRKLDSIKLEDGESLADALGYIAAIDAEGFSTLSFQALGAVLSLTVPQLQAKVTRPLGKEAAATTTSNAIYTRHKYIANAIIEVLETKFEKDISNYFINLSLSESVRARTEDVLNLGFWRYDLSEHLYNSGKIGLSISLAKRLYEQDEGNFYLLTKLASIYRRANNASQAVRLFREFSNDPKNRGFYFEWGVCEGNERHHIENAYLVSFAMSDDVESSIIGIEQGYMFLNALSKCFRQIYTRYVDYDFFEASSAAFSLISILQRKLPDRSKAKNEALEGYLKAVSKNQERRFSRVDAIKRLKEISSKLMEYGVHESVLRIVDIKLLEFNGLNRLIENAEATPAAMST